MPRKPTNTKNRQGSYPATERRTTQRAREVLIVAPGPASRAGQQPAGRQRTTPKTQKGQRCSEGPPPKPTVQSTANATACRDRLRVRSASPRPFHRTKSRTARAEKQRQVATAWSPGWPCVPGPPAGNAGFSCFPRLFLSFLSSCCSHNSLNS
jgi:hypothetical protein